MKTKTPQMYLLLAGASAIALNFAAPSATAQEDTERKLGTILVTTQKTEESIQDVPIAVSAFDEEALEKLQLAGGPDLVKTIPNVNFTKGNFTGFNFRIRGIGVDSVATSADAGVGVHQNDVPLQSNRLFEAEFYDVERVETLRGPQGTLYGRNATGGVVNVITAKPVFEEFQADAKFTYGSDNTVKGKGMINVPLGEKAALRLAGSYMTRDGFVKNENTGNDVDDRDLFGIRATLAVEPTDRLSGFLMYEHFEEDDTRLRSGKQLCAKDPFNTSFGGQSIGVPDILYTSLGCQEAALDDPASLTGVNTAGTLGGGYAILAGLLNGDTNLGGINPDFRSISAAIDPSYQAEQDLITWRAEYELTDSLTATYLGSHTESSSVSQEDYNKYTPSVAFNTAGAPLGNPALAPLYQALFPNGIVNDPQLGPRDRLTSFDLSGSDSEATTHELRVQSDFDGPFNFNVGGITMDYEVNNPDSIPESYYVFSNGLTAFSQLNNALGGAILGGPATIDTAGDGTGLPLSNLNGQGSNYFRSISPFKLKSFALFGEGYYEATDDLKFTLGLRYTSDEKSQLNIPTFLFTPDAARPGGYLTPVPIAGATDDEGGDGTFNVTFEEVTGRFGFDWSPDFDFSEDTLIYAFYSRGYKGGGINPPQPADNPNAFAQFFDPEFINAYEIGTKNTLANGALQLNATGFYYDYKGYQITQIVNRTSANFNVDAEIKGFELETVWNPVSTLVVNANLGLLDAQVVDTFGVDVLNRTNSRADLVTLKNAQSFSNCVVSAQGYATILGLINAGVLNPGDTGGLCLGSFAGLEAAFGVPSVTYVDSNGDTQTIGGLTPFDGEATSLDGNSLPGTPDSTFSLGVEYTFEALQDSAWDLRLRGDYYYQADAFSRVWNTTGDRLQSWDNINLSLQLSNSENGLAFEVFGKNIADDDVITGAYLTDDSSGLFRNVFLNEPATYGVSVSKRW